MFDQNTSDKCNPVLWKELHLMHTNRSMYLIPILVVCLEAIFFMGLSYLRAASVETSGYFFRENSSLLWLFYILMGGLTLGWLFLQMYAPTSRERLVEGLDPMLGTRLSPLRVLLGKYATVFLGVLLLQLLQLPFFFYSADDCSMRIWPFLGMTCCALATGFWLVTLAFMPKSTPSRNLSLGQGAGIVALLPLVGFYFFLSYLMTKELGTYRLAKYVKDNCHCIVWLVALMVFSFCLGLGFLRNTRQECSWPWRLCAVIEWLVLAAILVRVQEFPEEAGWLTLAPTCGFLTSILIATFGTFERYLPSRRTLQETGRQNLFARIALLPFRSGLGPGILLAWLVFLVSSLLKTVAVACGQYDEDFDFLQTTCAYFLLYAPLIADLAQGFHFKRETGCLFFVCLVFFLPIFAEILEAKILAVPSPIYPLMAEDEGKNDLLTIVVALVAVLPGTVALFHYCQRYFSRNTKG